jgi:16S rRNA C967 or C1407 C5-methylase (RsmB/RsmF family)
MTKEGPSKLIQKLSRKLFEDATERESFENCLVKPARYAESLLWLKPDAQSAFEKEFGALAPRPEQPSFITRLAFDKKNPPGKHPLHASGDYYILDYSSVLAAIPLLALGSANTVLDLCAAPGGKSIFAYKALNPVELIANEVVGQRCSTLRGNLKRCHVDRARVTSSRAEWWAENLKEQASVVILDAPCSGQSLLAKGEKAHGAFHPSIINGNSNRQKRLMAQASESVAPGGYLLYSTCTFAIEENEDVINWFLKKFEGFTTVAVDILKEFQSRWTSSGQYSYRLFPHSSIGAGAFTTLLKRI